MLGPSDDNPGWPVADLFQHQLDVSFEINGARHRLSVPASATLLDVLRERLRLYGTKKGCDLGACGACTVLVDGRRANACLMLAAMQDGRRIATIEGVARRTARCTRCSRPSSSTTPCNAATARRDRSCRRWA